MSAPRRFGRRFESDVGAISCATNEDEVMKTVDLINKRTKRDNAEKRKAARVKPVTLPKFSWSDQ